VPVPADARFDLAQGLTGFAVGRIGGMDEVFDPTQGP
jgi:hypothetical protein